MSTALSILLIIGALYIIISTLYYVRHQSIPVRYSLVWLFSGFILLFLSIFPNEFYKLTEFVGFKTPSNFIAAVVIFFLLVITRMLTKVVSELNKKIVLLTQELSIVKAKQDGKDK